MPGDYSHGPLMISGKARKSAPGIARGRSGSGFTHSVERVARSCGRSVAFRWYSRRPCRPGFRQVQRPES